MCTCELYYFILYCYRSVSWQIHVTYQNVQNFLDLFYTLKKKVAIPFKQHNFIHFFNARTSVYMSK